MAIISHHDSRQPALTADPFSEINDMQQIISRQQVKIALLTGLSLILTLVAGGIAGLIVAYYRCMPL